jgi:hypothetical protein
MKRKVLSYIMILSISCLTILPGCVEKDGTPYDSHFAFTEPAVVAPEDGTTLHITGTTVDLTWASTNESGDPIVADVYFGTESDPPLYKEANNALTLNVPVELGLTYYWHVRMRDKNNIPSIGPVWSFTVFEPIGIFKGDFTCDEPAESYSYDVTFTKASATTLTTDNYWNSGWDATFTLNFTNNTYSMPVTVWATYSGQESGTIDPATGTMVGNYTIWHNAVAIETGVHTYTKK